MENRTIHMKTIDTSTMSGFERAVQFHSKNPDWKLVSKSFCEFEWLFEIEEVDGMIYSNELGKWLNKKEFGL
tara:strand:+ start:189 stop:404 length:216 start_codon:yes stop_codon:yes gene_type:complete